MNRDEVRRVLAVELNRVHWTLFDRWIIRALFGVRITKKKGGK